NRSSAGCFWADRTTCLHECSSHTHTACVAAAAADTSITDQFSANHPCQSNHEPSAALAGYSGGGQRLRRDRHSTDDELRRAAGATAVVCCFAAGQSARAGLAQPLPLVADADVKEYTAKPGETNA